MVAVADVLVLGFANLVADGISMRLGHFVSSSTEREAAATEWAVPDWDVNESNRCREVGLASSISSTWNGLQRCLNGTHISLFKHLLM